MNRQDLFGKILSEHGYQIQQIESLWNSRPPGYMDQQTDDAFEQATRLTAGQINPEEFHGFIPDNESFN